MKSLLKTLFIPVENLRNELIELDNYLGEELEEQAERSTKKIKQELIPQLKNVLKSIY